MPHRIRGECSICAKPHFGHGWCSQHYQAWWKHGDPLWHRPTAAELFWTHLAPPDDNGCRLWTGAVSRNGYGAVKLHGRMTSAHRAAWTYARGPIPTGMFVLHRCDVRRCCEPEHLFLGAQADNMRDMSAKGRYRNQWSH